MKEKVAWLKCKYKFFVKNIDDINMVVLTDLEFDRMLKDIDVLVSYSSYACNECFEKHDTCELRKVLLRLFPGDYVCDLS